MRALLLTQTRRKATNDANKLRPLTRYWYGLRNWGAFSLTKRFKQYWFYTSNSIYSSPSFTTLIYLQFLVCSIWCNSDFVHSPCHRFCLFYFIVLISGARKQSQHDTTELEWKGKKNALNYCVLSRLHLYWIRNGVRFISSPST